MNKDIKKGEGYIGIAQINPIAGDFVYNAGKIASYIRKSEALNLDMVIFPKYALTGCSMENIFNRHNFLTEEVLKWLNGLAQITKETVAVVGFSEIVDGKYFNSLAILKNGSIADIVREGETSIYSLNGIKYCIYTGENINYKECDVVVNCLALPSRGNSRKLKNNKLKSLATKYKTPIICVNQAGATDDNSYDGLSIALDKNGGIFALAKSFEEDFIVLNHKYSKGEIRQPLELFDENNIQKEFTLDYEYDLERVYKTIIQGIKDYFNKCGLRRAVLGLSGGLDSTVCAVLLTDALGKENVVGVSMPSKITSSESKSDAKILAENLGIHYFECPIMPMFDITSECLKPLFDGIEHNWNDRYTNSYTNDNIQARSRATYLWCVSNEFPRCMPIATSDKSELYMGYATINGDMSGGLAPIADVTKTKLFALARWLNKNREHKNAIPESVILKKPGAELAIDPKTGKALNAEDALMPYEFLDEVIWRLENKHESYNEMLSSEFLYEKKFNISQTQKTEWLDKFYKRMSVGGYKWSIMPPSILVEKYSVNKFDYHQPITSCRINYKGTDESTIAKILSEA